MRWFEAENKKSKDISEYSDLIDLSKNSFANIDQCLRDWTRNVDGIFIVGDNETKSLRAICSEEGIEDPLEMDEGQLRQIWQKYFLDGTFDGDKQVNDLMMDHFEQTMHQGGYLYMLQSSCFDVGMSQGFMLSSDKIDYQVTFFKENDGIGIIESLQIKQYNSLYDGSVVAGDGKESLIAAMGVYSLTFDSVSHQPKCDITKVVLDPKEDFTLDLFEDYMA